MSSSLTCWAAPSSMIAPSAPPKSILTRLPGTHACPCCIRPTSSCLVIALLSPLSAATSGVLRQLQAHPISRAMGYETSLKLLIDGVWESGEGRDAHSVVNPVDASAIAEVPYASPADLDEALVASERAWPEWRALDVEKRGAILHKAAALLRERAALIAATMTQEQGKPLAESKSEVFASAQLFDWYSEDAKREDCRTLVRPAGQLSSVIRPTVGTSITFP